MKNYSQTSVRLYDCMDFSCRKKAIAKARHGKLLCASCYLREMKREEDEPLFF
jgi:hypothetical protein